MAVSATRSRWLACDLAMQESAKPDDPVIMSSLLVLLQVPVGDNYFAALNSAVFSDGSFVYVPKGVKSPMELSTYFRINASETGQVRAANWVARGLWAKLGNLLQQPAGSAGAWGDGAEGTGHGYAGCSIVQPQCSSCWDTSKALVALLQQSTCRLRGWCSILVLF